MLGSDSSPESSEPDPADGENAPLASNGEDSLQAHLPWSSILTSSSGFWAVALWVMLTGKVGESEPSEMEQERKHLQLS